MHFIPKTFKYFFCVIAITISVNVYAQPNLVITGTAPLLKDGTEVSIEQVVPKRFPDSKVTQIVRLKNHKFKFLANEAGAELYYLSAGAHGRQLFLEPGNVNILLADSLLKDVTVTGSNTYKDFEKYGAILDSVSLFNKYSRARHDYDVYVHRSNADSLTANKKMQKRDSLLLQLNQQLSNIAVNWIKTHPNSLINPYVIYSQVEYMPENDLKHLYQKMPVGLKNNSWAKELRYRIDSLFIGGRAPDFSQPDALGKPVKLSNFRGKYVLVDFWASWCLPCRAESPNLVGAFQRFGSKNFTIVSVSLDDKKEAWLAAIKYDGLQWSHVSSLQGWQNPVSMQYYIHEIPDNFLIDPNGKIIARDLHGDNLITTLNKLIKSNN